MQSPAETIAIRFLMADFFSCYLTSSSNLNLAAPFILSEAVYNVCKNKNTEVLR